MPDRGRSVKVGEVVVGVGPVPEAAEPVSLDVPDEKNPVPPTLTPDDTMIVE